MDHFSQTIDRNYAIYKRLIIEIRRFCCLSNLATSRNLLSPTMAQRTDVDRNMQLIFSFRINTITQDSVPLTFPFCYATGLMVLGDPGGSLVCSRRRRRPACRRHRLQRRHFAAAGANRDGADGQPSLKIDPSKIQKMDRQARQRGRGKIRGKEDRKAD